MQLTFKYRIKDKHAARLNAQARGVNFVWNYCNETQQKAARARRKWLSGHDLWKLVAGATKEGLDLHSHSAMRVCKEYDKARRQHRRAWLRWRSRKSLGWVPFNTGHVAFRDGAFVFRGETYNVGRHCQIPDDAKAITQDGSMLEVCERHTSQSCSKCGGLPATRPRGIAGLRKSVRRLRCGSGDVNAARNDLRVGQDTLGGGAHV